MSVYVDDLMVYPNARGIFRRDRAVAPGAIEVSGRDLIMLWRAQQKAVQIGSGL